MNASQLVPAHKLAMRYGVKMLCYGAPGSGKTPLVNTAPRPVLLVTEPGMLSMRTSNVPCWVADTPSRIGEFFDWVRGSAEVKNFDTICVDSVSQMAETILAQMMDKFRDGRKAYGEMSSACMEHLDLLFFMQQKHVYLIAKESVIETVNPVATTTGIQIQTTQSKSYFFPGKDLHTKVGHRYDLIAHAERAMIPGHGEQRVLRTKPTDSIIARDRSGLLDEFEPHNLAALFTKAMQ